MMMQDLSESGGGQLGTVPSLDEARVELSRVVASSTGWNDGCDQAANTFVKVGLKRGLPPETLRRELYGYGLSKTGVKAIMQTAVEFNGSEEAYRAHAALPTSLCILAFMWGVSFFPSIILAATVAYALDAKGYKRRVNEFWRCWFQGVLFLIMVAVIFCVAIYIGTFDIRWLMGTVGFVVLWIALSKVGKRRLSRQQIA